MRACLALPIAASLNPPTESLKFGFTSKDPSAVVWTISSERSMAKKDTFRIVTRGCDGSLMIRDYQSYDPIAEIHHQIGVDDCSTDLELRGMPIFKGLIGPMPEGKTIVRYESPEVFETLTKEWGEEKPRRSRSRGRRSSAVAS